MTLCSIPDHVSCFNLMLLQLIGHTRTARCPAGKCKSRRQCDACWPLLRHETPDFITPDLWPPTTPNLNPVDYEVWGVMQEHVYQKPVRDVDELKQRLIETWSGIQQSVIDQATDQWRDRLNACVKANLSRLLKLTLLRLSTD